MYCLQILFTTLVTIQVYYMYKFIYSIPFRYKIRETNEYMDVDNFLRGVKDIYHGMHRRIRQPLPHLEQMKNGNNTASFYILLTNLDVVDRF